MKFTKKEKLLVAFAILLAVVGHLNEWLFGYSIPGISADRLSQILYLPGVTIVIILLARRRPA